MSTGLDTIKCLDKKSEIGCFINVFALCKMNFSMRTLMLLSVLSFSYLGLTQSIDVQELGSKYSSIVGWCNNQLITGQNTQVARGNFDGLSEEIEKLLRNYDINTPDKAYLKKLLFKCDAMKSFVRSLDENAANCLGLDQFNFALSELQISTSEIKHSTTCVNIIEFEFDNHKILYAIRSKDNLSVKYEITISYPSNTALGGQTIQSAVVGFRNCEVRKLYIEGEGTREAKYKISKINCSAPYKVFDGF